MRNKLENICRLCSNVMTNEFMEIDAAMSQMFDIFLLKLDLNIIRDPIICRNCVEIAKICLKFKLTCLSTERIILLLSIEGGDVKHDIKVIYKESECMETVVGKDLNVCRICLVPMERSNYVSLDTWRNETTVFEIVSGYLPEMDTNIIKNPMICTTCRINLERYFKFMINCLDTEGKIKALSTEEGTDRMDHVNLANVRHFLFKDFLEHSEEYSQICISKEETNTVKHTMYVYPEAQNEFIKLEELEIKEEIDLKEKSYKNLPEMQLDKYMLLPKDFDKETKSDSIHLTTKENNSKYTIRKEVIANDIESNSNQENALEIDKSKSPEMQTNQRIMCIDQRKHVEKGLITNTGPSEAYTLHKYAMRTSEGKRQSVLEISKKIHKAASQYKKISNINSSKLYKCAWCTYESKDRSCFRRHTLVHKDVSEIKMHKCSMCIFETRHKCNLKSHMLVHQDISEIKMHKCSRCTFETKHRGNIKNHMLTHKDVSEIKMQNCLFCDYKAKSQDSLKIHMVIIHQDILETNK